MQAKLASCQHLEKPMQRSAATSPIKPISLVPWTSRQPCAAALKVGLAPARAPQKKTQVNAGVGMAFFGIDLLWVVILGFL